MSPSKSAFEKYKLRGLFSEFYGSPFEFHFRKICQQLTNWTRWNQRDEVWGSVNSLFESDVFRSSRRRSCLRSLSSSSSSFTKMKNTFCGYRSLTHQAIQPLPLPVWLQVIHVQWSTTHPNFLRDEWFDPQAPRARSRSCAQWRALPRYSRLWTRDYSQELLGWDARICRPVDLLGSTLRPVSKQACGC